MPGAQAPQHSVNVSQRGGIAGEVHRVAHVRGVVNQCKRLSQPSAVLATGNKCDVLVKDWAHGLCSVYYTPMCSHQREQ